MEGEKREGGEEMAHPSTPSDHAKIVPNYLIVLKVRGSSLTSLLLGKYSHYSLEKLFRQPGKRGKLIGYRQMPEVRVKEKREAPLGVARSLGSSESILLLFSLTQCVILTLE